MRFWILRHSPVQVLDGSTALTTGFRFSIGRSGNKKLFVLFPIALLIVFCVSADAQQSEKIPKVGFFQRRVEPGLANPDPLASAFRQGLRELGYV